MLRFTISLSCFQYPLFLELFVEVLFTSKAAKVNPDHKHKYIYLLAYAASVTETWRKVGSAVMCLYFHPVYFRGYKRTLKSRKFLRNLACALSSYVWIRLCFVSVLGNLPRSADRFETEFFCGPAFKKSTNVSSIKPLGFGWNQKPLVLLGTETPYFLEQEPRLLFFIMKHSVRLVFNRGFNFLYEHFRLRIGVE